MTATSDDIVEMMLRHGDALAHTCLAAGKKVEIEPAAFRALIHYATGLRADIAAMRRTARKVKRQQVAGSKP